MKKIVFILLIILVSCNTQKNIKSDYQINPNETIEIELASNPTTGYSWKWIKNQNQRIDSVSTTYIPTKVEEGIVGSGGKEIWKFKALKSGTDTITLEYCRPWESNSTVETKKISVTIK